MTMSTFVLLKSMPDIYQVKESIVTAYKEFNRAQPKIEKWDVAQSNDFGDFIVEEDEWTCWFTIEPIDEDIIDERGYPYMGAVSTRGNPVCGCLVTYALSKISGGLILNDSGMFKTGKEYMHCAQAREHLCTLLQSNCTYKTSIEYEESWRSHPIAWRKVL